MSPIGHVFERSVSADGMALKGDEPSGDRVLLEEASPEILHSLTVYSLLSYVNAIKIDCLMVTVSCLPHY